MLKKYLFPLYISIVIVLIVEQPIQAANDNFEVITFSTEDGGLIEASFFKGDRDLVVIFAHGAIFNKESWYFMAEKLREENISSLSLDFRGYGNSKKGTGDDKALDILGAIDYLKAKGYHKIALVGGSMGGAAILNALEKKTDPSIQKVALLSPAGGPGIESKIIKKLIVVSKDESYYDRVHEIYEKSYQPKAIKVYPGTFHAQHMFKAAYSDELTNAIIQFLKI